MLTNDGLRRESKLDVIRADSAFCMERRGTRQIVTGTVQVTAPIIFAPAFVARIRSPSSEISINSAESGLSIGWLPRGTYRLEFALPGEMPTGDMRFSVEVFHICSMKTTSVVITEHALRIGDQGGSRDDPRPWALEATPPTPALSSLSWSRGHSDWFFRHFDHAAPTIISYLLGDHPALRGRILDIGCGDGITDLGVALRTQCEQLIGIDPFRQFERLPAVLAENNLPPSVIPANLRFMAEDANFLPFPDDSFDVVISWGSLEHIAGGYLQALREVKRVLKKDGLIMAAPGLYYSNIGHNLDEFCKEPFFHLKMPRQQIRKLVLETPPRYIDRAGEFSSNEQFWQWFTELNPITVQRFEQEMRALEFAPWRVALRTDQLVEYTPELESYPIQDLANVELYSSWISRKKAR